MRTHIISFIKDKIRTTSVVGGSKCKPVYAMTANTFGSPVGVGLFNDSTSVILAQSAFVVEVSSTLEF